MNTSNQYDHDDLSNSDIDYMMNLPLIEVVELEVEEIELF